MKTWFDFWVGEWEVTWSEGDGKIGKGKNTITKTLGGTVIQENFVITEGANKGYLGTSISVLGSATKQWHQAYADNEGAFYNFIGEKRSDLRMFTTIPETKDGKVLIQRMTFKEIKSDSLVWDWEKTEDGGKTWRLDWRINYKRL